MTKSDIEKLAYEIMDYLTGNHLDSDVFIYFNGKRLSHKEIRTGDGNASYETMVEEDICPLDYFEYASPKHILSMSFEGPLYYSIGSDDEFADGLSEILDDHGLYYELGDAWNLSVYPDEEEMYDEIEFTDYRSKVKPEPVHLCRPDDLGVPTPLFNIMAEWYELSKKTGDVGSCVVCAGFTFIYEGVEYSMPAQSPYQGGLSWEPHIETIRKKLEDIGATEIKYHWGHMD